MNKVKPVGTNHHMPVAWHEEIETDRNVPAGHATLHEKTSIICRMAALFLKSGSGGWRVRDAVNRTARALNVTATVSIGLTDIECTVREGAEQISQTVVIPESGVNTNLVLDLDKFLVEIDDHGHDISVTNYHLRMDEARSKKALYNPYVSGLASAAACGAFTFLLGGGLIEMICAFVGAGIGQIVRRLLLANRINQLLAVGLGVACSCLAYFLSLCFISLFVPDALMHQMGYFGAMLFVIPGFPLITAALDMYLFDMRSGIERLVYASLTILLATLVGWMLAVFLQLKPGDFLPLDIPEIGMCGLRLVAAFVGVFGFSIMFNSPVKVAFTAGVMGGISDTLNLELVKYFGFAPEIGAFVGAFTAGILASLVWQKTRYPRTAITVPSVVIMVPGLYLYKAMFFMAQFETGEAFSWLIHGVMVIVCLPFGLVLARALTDSHWRHTS